MISSTLASQAVHHQQNQNQNQQVEIWRYAYDFILENIKEKEEIVKIPRCVIENLVETIGIDLNSIDFNTKEGTIYAFEWMRDLLKVKKKEKTSTPPPKIFYTENPNSTQILKEKYTPKELSTIALVVNPNPSKRWKIKPLIRAFRHLVVFESALKFLVDKESTSPESFLSSLGLLKQRTNTNEENEITSLYAPSPTPTNYFEAINGLVGSLPLSSSIPFFFSKKSEAFPESYDPIMVFCLLVLLKKHVFLSNDMSFDTLSNILLFELTCSISNLNLKTFKLNAFLSPDKRYPSEKFYKTFFQTTTTTTTQTSSSSFCVCSTFDLIVEEESIREHIEKNILGCAKHLCHLKGSPGERFILPSHHLDAIALAGLLYGIDLSLSKCPCIEFVKIQLDYTSTKKYTPLSIFSDFGVWYSRSKTTFFDISKRWVPYFSPLYTRGQLEFFAHLEGFKAEKIRDMVVYTSDDSFASGFSSSSLTSTSTTSSTPPPPPLITITPPPPPPQTSTLLVQQQQSQQPSRVAFFSPQEALNKIKGEIVFKGWHPKTKNTQSPICLEDLQDVLNEHGETGILTFLLPSSTHEDPTLIGYSLRDVCDLFISSRAYLICDENGKTIYLSKRTVAKLRELYSNGNNNEEDPKERANSEILKAAMRIVDMRDVELSDHANEILKIGKGDEKAKNQATHAFFKLLDLGMYMRGWKVAAGSTALPLASVDTIIEPEKQIEVDLNVTEALREYEETLSQIENTEMRRLVRSAPLLKVIYRSNPPHFASTVNMEQGFTVEDRVSIIREGTDGSIFSCMRMSSNFLVASAYYYLSTSLFKDPGFDIAFLDEIL